MSSKTINNIPRDLLGEASEAFAALGMHGYAERLNAFLDAPEQTPVVGAAQYWSENEQALRDVCKFEGLKGLVWQVVRDVQARQPKPVLPLRPPEGVGIPRYGLQRNGPQQPLAVELADGYWTPWHLAKRVADERLELLSGAEEVIGQFMPNASKCHGIDFELVNNTLIGISRVKGEDK